MKIKLSRSQWEETGRKAGWIKQAGTDWFINKEYTNNVVAALKKEGNNIVSVSDHTIYVNYKMSEDKSILLKLEVYEMEYSQTYMSTIYGGKQMFGMPEGDTAEELVANIRKHMEMILGEVKHQQFLKDI